MKPAYKMIKVFDCQDMPANVRDAFWKSTEGAGNDCYVSWYWDVEGNKNHATVNEWLKANGGIEGERILINHWW